MKIGEFYRPRSLAFPPMITRHHIKQLLAIAANHRLHFAMPATVRAAGDFGAIMTLRAFK